VTGEGRHDDWNGKSPDTDGDPSPDCRGRIKRDHVTFYFPLATSIIVSVVGSLILYLFFRR